VKLKIGENSVIYEGNTYCGNSVHWSRERLKNFMTRVWEFRKAMGWTQMEMARQLGVDRRTVQNMEGGEYGPSPKVLRRFNTLQARIREQKAMGKLLQDGGIPVDFGED